MIKGINDFLMHQAAISDKRLSESGFNLNGVSKESRVKGREKVGGLKKGAQAFESYFIHSLLKEMRKGVLKKGEGGVGLGEEMYQSMFDEAIAQKIAENGGIGLAKLLIEKLSDTQISSDQSADFENRPKVFKPVIR